MEAVETRSMRKIRRMRGWGWLSWGIVTGLLAVGIALGAPDVEAGLMLTTMVFLGFQLAAGWALSGMRLKRAEILAGAALVVPMVALVRYGWMMIP